jgi:hypothetical protein
MKAPRPWEQSRSTKKKKPAMSGPADVSRRYSLPLSMMQEIKKAAPLYRSRGRVLQVATELLVRICRPFPRPAKRPA